MQPTPRAADCRRLCLERELGWMGGRKKQLRLPKKAGQLQDGVCTGCFIRSLGGEKQATNF